MTQLTASKLEFGLTISLASARARAALTSASARCDRERMAEFRALLRA